MRHTKRIRAFFGLVAAAAASVLGATGASTALAANSGTDGNVPNDPQRGSVIVYKYDAETDLSAPQGGASLEGAEFTITNKSDHTIVYYDEFGHASVKAVNESWVIKTKWDDSLHAYVAKTPAKGLPYGTYHIQETKSSPGYALATDENYINRPYIPGYMSARDRAWVKSGYTFSISSEGQVVTFGGNGTNRDTAAATSGTGNYTAGPGAYNPLIRGGLEVAKRDHDLKAGIPQGNSALRDGIWVIYNWNAHPVRVWDHFDQTNPNGLLTGVVADNYSEASRFTSTPGDYTNSLTWAPKWSTQMQATVQGNAKDATGAAYNVVYGSTAGTSGGWVKPGDVVAVIRSGDDGRAQTFMDALPVGYYKIVEVEAPLGYANSELWQSFPSIQEHNWDELVATDCDDPVGRGAVEFHKVDSDVRIKPAHAQGNMTLAGAVIDVYNASDREVVIRDAAQYNTGDISGIKGRVAPGKMVGQVVTDASGVATLKGLPAGTYYAVESKAPAGYQVNTEWKFNFTIEDTDLGKLTVDGNEVVVKTDDKITESGLTGETDHAALSEDVDRFNHVLTIEKRDLESDDVVSMVTGDACVAKFRVKNVSAGDVIWKDVDTLDGEDVYSWDIYKTGAYLKSRDGHDYFETDEFTGQVVLQFLPDGDYQIEEIEPPIGYQLSSPKVQTISLRTTTNEQGQTVQETTVKTAVFKNQVIREDLKFSKVDATTMQPMANVAFLFEKYALDGAGEIVKDDAGNPVVLEWHILVTDEDGMLDTSADSAYQSWRLHTINTNASDAAYNPETGKVDDSKLNYEQGYWFNGGLDVDANDNLGALPYGIYHLTELRCAANQGKALVERDVYIRRGANLVENIGTIDNTTTPPCDGPCADNTARSTEAKVELEANPANGSTVDGGQVITYTVHYENTTADPIPYLQIRDLIPESTTYVEDSASDGGVLSQDGSYLEWVIENVEPGASGTVTFQVKVDKNAARPVISHQSRFGVWTTEIVAGDPDNITPYGSSNVVQHSTDGSETISTLYAEKTSSVAPTEQVQVGDTITYTIKVTNTGHVDLTNIGVSDNVPQHTHVHVLNGPETEYQDKLDVSDGGRMLTDSTVVWDIARIRAGESVEVSFTVVVDDTVGTRVANQATYGFTSGKCNGEMDNVTNIVSNKVKTDPELSITKSSSAPADGVSAGEFITYTLHVENNGRGNAVNVPVFDVIPEGTQYVMGSASTTFRADESHVYPFTEVAAGDAGEETPYVSWTIPVIYNRGGSIDVSYTVRVKDNATVGSHIINAATVGGEEPLPVDTTEPTSTDDVNVPAISNKTDEVVVDALDGVTVEKTADPESGTNVAPGDIITYTITWKNDENGHPVQGFGVRDAIPEHTTFVDGSIVMVGADGKSSTEIAAENQAASEAGDDCGQPVPASSNDSVVWVPRAAINRADSEGIYRALMGGDESTHHLRIGWRTLKSTLEHLEVGESFEFEVAVDNDYDQLWRATYREDGTLVLLMRLIVPSADDSPNYATVNGGRANYDQKWRDVWAIVDELKPGETGSLTFQVRVDDDVEANTDIVNVATYGSGVFAAPCFDLPNETNETVHTVGVPHLVGTKVANPSDYARVGDTIHYTVQVTNDGTARAHDVAVFDRFRDSGALTGVALVPGSWKVSGGDAAQTSKSLAPNFGASAEFVYGKTMVLEPGDTLTMEFDVVIVDAKSGDKIENVASFESNHTDLVSLDDLAEQTNSTSIEIDEPNLRVSKSVNVGSGNQVKVGDTLEYTISVTNDAHVAGNGFGVFDAIPNNTVYVAGSATGGLQTLSVTEPDPNAEPIVDEQTGEQTIPTIERVTAVAAEGVKLNAGETKTFKFKVTVDPTLLEDTIINNSATAGVVDELPGQPLEFRSETITNEAIAPKTAIRVSETSDPAPGSDIAPGDVVTYTIEVFNESVKPAKDVCVFTYVPAGMTYVNGSATGGLELTRDTQTGAPALVATGLELGDHGRMTLTFQARANQTWSDRTVVSHATAGTFEGTPKAELEVDSGEVLHNVRAIKPVLSVSTKSDPATGTEVKAGDVITYTVKVSETAGAPVDNGAVFAYLPAGVELVDGGLAGGLEAVTDSEGNAIAVRATGLNLDPFGTATLVFKARVLDTDDDLEISETVTVGTTDIAPTAPLPTAAGVVIHNVIAPKPELTLVKSATPDGGETVMPGDTVTYVMTLKNIGAGKANGAAVFDAIPAHTTLVEGSLSGLKAGDGFVYADGIDLAAGESRSFAFAVTVDEGIVENGVAISNQATFGYAEAPTEPLANASNAVDHNVLVPVATIAVIDSATPEQGSDVVAGDSITYNFTVSETAGNTARNVSVFAYVPENVTLVDATGLDTVEIDGRQALVASGITLAGNASKDFSVTVTANDVNEDTGIVFRPTAAIDEQPVAPLSIDGAELRHNIIAPKADLRIALDANPTDGSNIESGDVIDYVVTLTNDSNAVARDAAVYMAVPENTTYVDRSATGGLKPVTDEAGNVIALAADHMTLGAGATKTFRLAVTASEDLTEDFQVTAQATCGFGAANQAFSGNVSNTVQHGVHVPKPALSMSQFADPADGSAVEPGDTISYTLKVRETAGVKASGVAVFDAIPANTEFVSASENLRTITDESGKVIAVAADGIDIPAGGQANFGFVVKVADVDNVSIKNDASCDFASDPTAPLAISANQVSHNVAAAVPVLSIVAGSDPASGTNVKSGDVIAYTIKVSETSGVAAKNVAVFDYVPANTELVEGSLTGGLHTVTDESGKVVAVAAEGINLDANGSVELGFSVKVADADDVTISNEATCGISAEQSTLPLGTASQQVLHAVRNVKPMLSVSTTATPAEGSQVKPGDKISYTVTVSEVAGAPAKGVAIFDELPLGVTVDETTLASGVSVITDAAGKKAIVADGIDIDALGSKAITFDVTVDETTEDLEISNRATAGFATAPTSALPETSKQVTHLVGALKPVLSVELASTPASGTNVSAGDTISYTITVSETAGAPATGAAVFAKVPSGVTIDESSLTDGLTLKDGALVATGIELAAKGSKTYTFKATVNEVTEDTVFTSRATAGFAENPTKDLPYVSEQLVHTTLAPRPELSVGLAASADTAAPGDTITYVATVSETAGAPAKGAAIFVELPAGVTVDESTLPEGARVVRDGDTVRGVALEGIEIAPNGEVTLEFSVTVDATESDSSISARATAGMPAGEVSGPLGNDSKEAVTSVVAGKPKLRIEKASTPEAGVPVNVDDFIDYTFTVTNDGDGTAHGVAVFDAIPAATTYVANSAIGGLEPIEVDGNVVALGATGIELAPGESKTFGFSVQVAFDIDDDTVISNRATVGFSDTATSALENDSNEVATTVVTPDTKVTMTSDPATGSTVYEGQDVNFDVRVTNDTTARDRNVSVFVPVPAGLTYDSVVAPDEAEVAPVTDADGNVIGLGIHFDTVPANYDETIRVTFVVDGSQVTDVFGNATYGHGDGMPTAALDTEAGQTRLTVDRVPHLSIVKSQNPPSGSLVAGGDVLTYSITVTNTGLSTAHKVGIYDEAPEHTRFVSGSLTTDRGETYVGDDGLLTVIAGDLKPGETATMTFKAKIDYGFTGAIYNRAMWVSPAADPGTAPASTNNSANESDQALADVTSAALAGPLAATVPIPDGSYSGVSNEVSAGDTSQDTGHDSSEPDAAELVDVPNVVGKGESDARSEIKGAGLKVSVTTANSDTVPEGIVISQDKTGKVAKGATVGIVVSEGKAAAPATNPTNPSDSGNDSGSGNEGGDSGSNETAATVQATEVELVLSADPKGGSEVGIGAAITYTLKIKNAAKVNANDLYVATAIPAGIKVSDGTIIAKGITAEIKDGKLVAHGSLAPSKSATVTFTGVVQGSAGDSISVQSEWGQSEWPDAPAKMVGKSNRVVHEIANSTVDGDSNETSAHVSAPQVIVTKVSDPEDGAIVKPGSTISYTIRVANVGEVNANDLYVRDALADGLTLDEASLAASGMDVKYEGGAIIATGTLAAGKSANIVFKAKVADDFAGDIKNVVEWGQSEPGTAPEEMTGKSNEVLAHVGTTEVSLIKSANVADGASVGYGDIIEYTIVAKNEGTLASGADVVVSDKLPAGLELVSAEGGKVDGSTVTFDSVHLGKGESATFKLTAKVTATEGDVLNEAVAKVSNQDDVTSNSITSHVFTPDLSVAKVSDPASGSTVKTGDSVAYSIVVSNTGKVPGSVTFTDIVPDSLEFDSGKGLVARLFKMPEGDKDAASLVAAAGSAGGSELSTTVEEAGVWPWLCRAFMGLFGQGEDVAAKFVEAEHKVTGTVDIPAGYCLVVSYGTTVVTSDVNASIENSVTISAPGVDDEHASSKLTVDNGVADVQMVKSSDPANGSAVSVGDVITYSMYLENKGTGDSGDAEMHDSIPSGTSYVTGSAKYVDGDTVVEVSPDNNGKVSYTVGKLAAGAKSGTLSFQVKVDETDSNSGIVTNTGHFNIDGGEDKPSNEVKLTQATVKVTKVGIDANGKETKTFVGGSEVRWLITVENTSGTTADFVVEDRPSSGLSFLGSAFVTDQSGKAVTVYTTGESDTEAKADTLLRNAQSAALMSASTKTYGIKLDKNDGVFYNGKALVAKLTSADSDVSAMPVPAGTYTATALDGNVVTVTIYNAADDGSVDLNKPAGEYSVSASGTQVTVGNNCCMVVKSKKSDGTANGATENVMTMKQESGAANSSSTGSSSTSSSSSKNASYSAWFMVDDLAAGEKRSFIVKTRATANAPATVSNTVRVSNGENGAAMGSVTASLSKSGESGKSGSSTSKGSLPKTAASIMALGAIGAGAAFVAFGGVELVRSRARKDEEAPKED